MENLKNCCSICYQNVDIQSIGQCDHPICFQCSTRLRVICKNNECPTCREDIGKVIFTTEIKPYHELKELYNDEEFADHTHGICFSSDEVRERYECLLEYRCQICNKEIVIFPTFETLEEHLKIKHKLYFCGLCATLNLFPFERRCYLESELKRHNKFGDPENPEYNGHPFCKFCKTHFLDKYDMNRHLFEVHCCRFCTTDRNNDGFISSDELRKHFKEKHFLCQLSFCQKTDYHYHIADSSTGASTIMERFASFTKKIMAHNKSKSKTGFLTEDDLDIESVAIQFNLKQNDDLLQSSSSSCNSNQNESEYTAEKNQKGNEVGTNSSGPVPCSLGETAGDALKTNENADRESGKCTTEQ